MENILIKVNCSCGELMEDLLPISISYLHDHEEPLYLWCGACESEHTGFIDISAIGAVDVVLDTLADNTLEFSLIPDEYIENKKQHSQKESAPSAKRVRLSTKRVRPSISSRTRRSRKNSGVKELEDNLSKQLVTLRKPALRAASSIKGRKLSTQSFHGIIGGKNNTYVDSVRMEFSSPDEFLARWIAGLRDAVTDGARRRIASRDLIRMLQDEIIFKYVRLFLERNFYRNLHERTRHKPTESLWEIWFGENKMVWGLLISPVMRNDSWTNDISEIRRVKFDYWTVEHLLSTGLIDPDSDRIVSFPNLESLLSFYQSTLKRLSNSKYEQEIMEKYVSHLKESSSPLDVPFLIPEVRYAGRERKHKYRLDFSVLNPYTRKMTGFEISPQSTHMKITGAKDKSQKEINEELGRNWEKEIDKRNKYYEDHGISVVTFTDSHLRDIEQCFARIEERLSARPTDIPRLQEQIAALQALKLD